MTPKRHYRYQKQSGLALSVTIVFGAFLSIFQSTGQ